LTVETRSPTSESGTWHDPTNAYNDDLAYAYCGNGEGGRTHDFEGYGFAAAGIINEVRVDVKGYSGDGTKHSVNVYVWDGAWQLVGTITATAECNPHQFDASSFINTPEKLNNIKTRIESVGLAGGGPTTRYVRVCWIPVYAAWTAAYNVHLESTHDLGKSANLGTLIFDAVTYELPDDVVKAPGDYQSEYDSLLGYRFEHWEIVGDLSVADSKGNPTTVTVNGAGTLKAVYAVSGEEALIAQEFPARYYGPGKAQELGSKVAGYPIKTVAQTFPHRLFKKGQTLELGSWWSKGMSDEDFLHNYHWDSGDETIISVAGAPGEQNLGGAVPSGKVRRIRVLKIRHAGTKNTVLSILVGAAVKLTIDVPPQSTRVYSDVHGIKCTETQQPKVQTSDVTDGSTYLKASGVER